MVPLGGSAQSGPLPPNATLLTTIDSVDSGNAGVMLHDAAASGSAASLIRVTWGTDNSAALLAAATACPSPFNNGSVASSANLFGFSSKGCVLLVPNSGSSGTGDYLFASGVVLANQTSLQIIGMGNSAREDQSSQAGVRFLTAIPITILTIGQSAGINNNYGGFQLQNITFRDTSDNGSALGGLLMYNTSEAVISFCSFEDFGGQQPGLNSEVKLSYGMKADPGPLMGGFNNNIVLIHDKGKNNSIFYDSSLPHQDGPIVIGGDIFPTNLVSSAPTASFTAACYGIVNAGPIRMYGTHFDVGKDKTNNPCVGLLMLAAGIVNGKFESSVGGGTGIQLLGGGSAAPTITSAVRTGGGVTVITGTSHGLVDGEAVMINAPSDTNNFAGTFRVTHVMSNTKFFYDQNLSDATANVTVATAVGQPSITADINATLNGLTLGVGANAGATNNRIVVHPIGVTTPVTDNGSNNDVEILGPGPGNSHVFTGSLTVPVSGGAAPTGSGQIAYDSTANSPVVGENLGGSSTAATAQLDRLISSQGPSSIVNAGTVGTTETAFDVSYPFPSGYWTVGKLVRVTAGIQYVAPGTVVSQQYKMRFNAPGPVNVTLFMGTVSSPGVSSTRDVGASFLLKCVTTGATGSIDIVNVSGLTPAGNSAVNATGQPVTFDTTAAQTLQFTVTFGGNTTGNTAQLRVLAVEELN